MGKKGKQMSFSKKVKELDKAIERKQMSDPTITRIEEDGSFFEYKKATDNIKFIDDLMSMSVPPDQEHPANCNCPNCRAKAEEKQKMKEPVEPNRFYKSKHDVVVKIINIPSESPEAVPFFTKNMKFYFGPLDQPAYRFVDKQGEPVYEPHPFYTLTERTKYMWLLEASHGTSLSFTETKLYDMLENKTILIKED